MPGLILSTNAAPLPAHDPIVLPRAPGVGSRLAGSPISSGTRQLVGKALATNKPRPPVCREICRCSVMFGAPTRAPADRSRIDWRTLASGRDERPRRSTPRAGESHHQVIAVGVSFQPVTPRAQIKRTSPPPTGGRGSVRRFERQFPSITVRLPSGRRGSDGPVPNTFTVSLFTAEWRCRVRRSSIGIPGGLAGTSASHRRDGFQSHDYAMLHGDAATRLTGFRQPCRRRTSPFTGGPAKCLVALRRNERVTEPTRRTGVVGPRQCECPPFTSGARTAAPRSTRKLTATTHLSSRSGAAGSHPDPAVFSTRLISSV